MVVVGLATDYCVRATALDAVQAGYTSHGDHGADGRDRRGPDDAVAEMELGGVDVA